MTKSESFDQEHLSRLAAYCDAFEARDFVFGTWAGGETDADGITRMPYFTLGDDAEAFLQHCYNDGWVMRDFDWGQWKESPEAIALRDIPEKLGSATPYQLAALLTVIIRQERFCEGSLQDAFKSGLILSILKRAKALTSGA